VSHFPIPSRDDLEAARAAAINCVAAATNTHIFFDFTLPRTDDEFIGFVEKIIRTLTEAAAALSLVEKVEHYLSNGEPVRVEGVGHATTFHRLACEYALRTRGAIYSGLMKARHEEDYRPITEVVKLRIAGKTVPRDLAKQNRAAVKRLEECNQQPFRLPQSVEELKAIWAPASAATIQSRFWPGDPGAITQALVVGIENEYLRAKKSLADKLAYVGRSKGEAGSGAGKTELPEVIQRKRGPKPKYDPKVDQRIFDAWKSGSHRDFAALAHALGMKLKDVRLAIDRQEARIRDKARNQAKE
jgi:hypothetical protein